MLRQSRNLFFKSVDGHTFTLFNFKTGPLSAFLHC